MARRHSSYSSAVRFGGTWLVTPRLRVRTRNHPQCLSISSTTTTSSSGYQSIGSFHNDNLYEILAQDDATYQPPPLPFDGSNHNDQLPQAQFDPVEYRAHHFSLDLTNWTFLNHGAFGAALRVGQDRAQQWRTFAETQPLRYHDRYLLPHLAHSARRLARFLVGPSHKLSLMADQYALLPNVTTGMNAVLHNYTLQQGEHSHIFILDTTYGSVKTMARHYGKRGKVTEIPILPFLAKGAPNQHNASQSYIFELALCNVLNEVGLPDKEGKEPVLILDQTTSNTALTLDVEQLAESFKAIVHPNAYVVVDGAHGLWAENTQWLATGDSSVDVYLTNGHKWLAAPRGVGLAWVRNQEARCTFLNHPTVLSHGAQAPDLLSRFVWDGCRDYTAALAVPAVLDFWEAIVEKHDESRVELERERVKKLLWRGVSLLAHQWHGVADDVTTIKDGGFDHGLLLASYEFGWLNAPMLLLRLPAHCEKANNTNTSEDAKRIQDYLYERQVEVPIKCIRGQLYVRLSCHVYNCLEDFDRLAKIMVSQPTKLEIS